MKPSIKKLIGSISVVLVLIAMIFAWRRLHPIPNPIVPGSSENIGDFDTFQRSLATRVYEHFGADASGTDFSAVVATTAYPIGTLLRASGSVPADLEDCVPQTAPTAYSAEHLFPSYTLSSDTAIIANLGSKAIQGLDSAGVNLKQSSTMRYTIENTRIQIMDDRSVQSVTAQGECGKYISAHPGLRLIRGTVTGKMTFTVKVDNPASVKAQLSKIGGFSINDNPGSSQLTISDNQSQAIVELLSEFNNKASSPSNPDAHPTPKAIAGASAGRSPASVDVTAHIFVQQDKNDTSEAGLQVIKNLRASWPKATVENRADRIPTEKMPDTAQVRYFNTNDLDRATKCLNILKEQYPTAQVVRIGLPSTEGQLEVWLPKFTKTVAVNPDLLSITPVSSAVNAQVTEHKPSKRTVPNKPNAAAPITNNTVTQTGAINVSQIGNGNQSTINAGDSEWPVAKSDEELAVAVLSQSRGKIRISFVYGSNSALGLAARLKNIFYRAKWEVDPISPQELRTDGIFNGLRVTFSGNYYTAPDGQAEVNKADNPQGYSLGLALSGLHIPYAIDAIRESNVPIDTMKILVGPNNGSKAR